jgi:hypothetical protein
MESYWWWPFFQQIKQLDAGFIQTLLGAIVGAAAAIYAQKMSIKAAASEKQRATLAEQQSRAFSLLVKIIRIQSNIKPVLDHIDAAVTKQAVEKAELWQTLLPILNIGDPVHINETEKHTLFELHNDEAFASVVDLDAIHNSLMEILREYRDMRNALMQSMKPSGFLGGAASGEFTRQEWLKIAPRVFEVNSIAEALRDRAKQDFTSASRALELVAPLMREKLGMKIKVMPIKDGADNKR